MNREPICVAMMHIAWLQEGVNAIGAGLLEAVIENPAWREPDALLRSTRASGGERHRRISRLLGL